jgi:hypothetical protein
MLKSIEAGPTISREQRDFEAAYRLVEASDFGKELLPPAQAFVVESFIELLSKARRITGSERLNGRSLTQALSVDDDIQKGVDAFDAAKRRTAIILATKYGLSRQSLDLSLQTYYRDCYTVIIGHGGNVEGFLNSKNPRKDATLNWLETLDNRPKYAGTTRYSSENSEYIPRVIKVSLDEDLF